MRPHFKFWPKRLPHAITLPATSLWDNLGNQRQRYPDKAALVFFGSVLTYAQLLQKVGATRPVFTGLGVEKAIEWCCACKLPAATGDGALCHLARQRRGRAGQPMNRAEGSNTTSSIRMPR